MYKRVYDPGKDVPGFDFSQGPNSILPSICNKNSYYYVCRGKSVEMWQHIEHCHLSKDLPSPPVDYNTSNGLLCT